MRALILFIFLLCLGLRSDAQGGFYKHFDFDSTFNLFANIIEHKDTLITHGLISRNEPTRQQGILFVKMDTLGNILQKTTHFDSLGRTFYWGGIRNSMIKLNDNSGYLIKAKQNLTLILLKLDNEGNLIWKKEYPDSRVLDQRNGGILEIDDGFLVFSWVVLTNDDINGHILKTDKEGKIIWSKYYGDSDEWGTIGGIIPTTDNELIVSGVKFAPFFTSTSDWYQSWIFAIDSLGNKKWEWKSIESHEEQGPYSLIKNIDGSWTYLTTREELIPGKSLILQPKIIQRDSNFNLIFEKNFGEPSYREFWTDMIQLSSGGWVAVGTDYFLANPRTRHLGGWIVGLDENFDTTWSHSLITFPDSIEVQPSINNLYSVVELSSGSIVASGYYEKGSFAGDFGRAILVKVDKNGCLDTISCRPVTSNIEVCFTKGEIEVYPNPTSDAFGVYFSDIQSVDIQLFNSAGQLVLRHRDLSSGEQVVVRHLPKGLYFYQIQNRSGQIYDVGKIVIKN